MICKWVKGYSLVCLVLEYFPFPEEQLPHAETAGKKERNRMRALCLQTESEYTT